MKSAVATILVLSCLSISFSNWSAQKNCEPDATNMAEIRYCESQQEEAAVEHAYDHLQRKLKRVNPDASTLLVQAQKDWLTFATSTCEYYTRIRTEDAMANDFRSQCWA